MSNATAFIAADRYLFLIDVEGQNPRHKADGMPNATAFTTADRYLLLLDAEGQKLVIKNLPANAYFPGATGISFFSSLTGGLNAPCSAAKCAVK